MFLNLKKTVINVFVPGGPNLLALTGSCHRRRKTDPKTRLDQARQPGKAVGPREGKLRFQTTRCYIEMPTTGLSSRAGRALQCLEHN